MRCISLHGDGVSHTEARSRRRAAGLAAASCDAHIMPDVGAIWEAKFIICFLRGAASSFSISDRTVTPSIKGPDTREDEGGDYVQPISN